MSIKYFYFTLIFPICVLAYLIISSEIDIRSGLSYEFPIEGRDPRDMLRGHYLTYRFKWPFDEEKTLEFIKNNNIVKQHDYSAEDCLCIDKAPTPERVFPIQCENSSVNCEQILKGHLEIFRNGRFSRTGIKGNDDNQILIHDVRFNTGIEKFYVPEEYAKQLESLVQRNIGSIRFKINGQKRAVIEELYFDKVPWKEKVN